MTLDRAELERLEKLELPEQDKWIIKTRFANGTRMYNIHDPERSLFMVRPDRWRLIPIELRFPPHHRVLGRRRLGTVPQDVRPDRKGRRGAAGALRAVQGPWPAVRAATFQRRSPPTAPRSGQTGRPPEYVLSVLREWHWVPEHVINWPPTRLKG